MMKMEMLPSNFSYGDEDRKNLQQLLEAFGSVVSLEDIASAYCKAGRDPSIAGDIICNLQASTSTTSSSENTEKSDTLHNDVEEFLFKMLGDGFSLNMSTIHNVVGQCGFDVNKSMESLIDLSAATLEKSDDIVSIDSEEFPNLKSNSSRDSAESSKRTKTNNTAADELQLQKMKRKNELQKEILQSLFSHPGRYDDEVVARPSKESRRSRFVVDKPLELPEIEHRTVIIRPHVTQMNDDDDDDNEESYEVLREAVKEHWTTMKEYYKAAIEAFVKEDRVRAYRLLEEGNFFMKKAREADEKSAQKLLQPRYKCEELSFDVHHFAPKDAIDFLKGQFNTYVGLPLPPFQCFRVIVGVNDDDATNGPRKRLVAKYFDKRSIPWTEEENGKVLVIKVEDIDRQKLTSYKSVPRN
ncbi:PREDICTED: putative nuclear RNA export factor SDE5 [Ipomoea nil]|uniref:putative nuclear RNA export factor SDE5 n=1 Tax=Ipomoea nil TaxID=35883 RepID=UPI00090190FC|nr:PREDICTED: putative nuclear RNA export factor SDE5 [Ipomoea nil]